MKYSADVTKMGYFIQYKRRDGFHPFEWLIYNEQINEGYSKEDSEFVHVETIISGDETINHAFPIARRCKPSKKHKGRYVRIVKYIGYDEGNLRFKVAAFAASLNNTMYGLFSLLWFKINHKVFKKDNVLASRHTPFCSFGCAWALKRAYPESFRNSSVTMPAAFGKNEFVTVWEGYIE